jgi:hypothetical protein
VVVVVVDVGVDDACPGDVSLVEVITNVNTG